MCQITCGNSSCDLRADGFTPVRTASDVLGHDIGEAAPEVVHLNRWRCPSCQSYDVFAWVGASPNAAECGNCGHEFSIG